MFLALRELRHSKLRYLLITAVIAMVSSLIFLVGGLADGLATGNSQAIDAISADAFVTASGSENLLDRSLMDQDTLEAVRQVEGVSEAEPLSAGVANVLRNDESSIRTISLIGVVPGSFLDPGVNDGEALGGDPNGVVIDRSMADEGVSIGDKLTTDPGGAELTVVGIVNGHQYRLIPTAFVSLETWQQIQPTGEGTINMIAVRGDSAAIDAIPNQVSHTQIASHGDIVNALPGYQAQEQTLGLIQIFLLVIAAGVIAAFFFIITLQKMAEIGVMKAIGTRTGFLARSLVLQVLILGIIGVLIGISVGCTTQIIAQGTVPFVLKWQQMALYSTVLLTVAVIGTVLSLRRIANANPLDAIANQG